MSVDEIVDTASHSRWQRSELPKHITYPRDVRFWLEIMVPDGGKRVMAWRCRCRTAAALELVMARFDAFCASLDGLVVVPADEAKK